MGDHPARPTCDGWRNPRSGPILCTGSSCRDAVPASRASAAMRRRSASVAPSSAGSGCRRGNTGGAEPRYLRSRDIQRNTDESRSVPAPCPRGACFSLASIASSATLTARRRETHRPSSSETSRRCCEAPAVAPSPLFSHEAERLLLRSNPRPPSLRDWQRSRNLPVRGLSASCGTAVLQATS
jgi:hypothetical protein